MTHTKTDTLFNKMRLEFNPLQLTKCGEIQINDCCTNAYIFCAFCSDDDDVDPDTKFFTTLQEFIDHIRWHRSEDLDSLALQNGTSNIGIEGQDDDSRSDLSAAPPIQEAEFLTDWIAPPEELFASNTISNFIEMEQPEEEQQDIENNAPQPDPDETDEDASELTGDVFVELLDLYKKCPCVWHDHIASTTNSDIINGVFKLLTAHFNKCAQQSKSIEYVRRILIQVKSCFLEEYKDFKETESDSLPWYFPYLNFLLNCDSNELDKSIFTDFVCSICTLELDSQDHLWNHILKSHLESTKAKDADNLDDMNRPLSNHLEAIKPQDADHLDDVNRPPSHETSVCEYPAEVVDKFIDIYRSQTRLWDKNDKEYNSRLLRRISYDLLLNILREHDPGATHAEVIQRIESLPDELPANGEKEVLCPDNKSLIMPTNQFQTLMENITLKKNRNPPPQLKVKPGNFRKKIKSGKCPICNMSFNEHSTWLSHMESAHTSEDYQSKDGFFYCTVCGWQNKTKKLLMRHLRNKHTNNLRRCTDCNLGFRLLSMLVEHRAKAHDDFNPFKCETCGDGFPSRSRLRTHATTHRNSEERSHWCVHCGSKFADKKSCRLHVRRHLLNKKELLCKFCQKKFPTLVELRKHMRTHLNSYANKCDACCKSFTSPTLLKKHLNEIHNGTNVGSHIFKNILKKQMAATTQIRLNQCHTSCDECGAKFFRKTSLLKHKRLKHEKKPVHHSQ